MDKINFKSIVKFLLIAFLLYAIFSSPDQSANVARSIGNVLHHAVTSLGEFFRAIIGNKK